MAILLLGLSLPFAFAAGHPALAADRDCADFPSQAAAQDHFVDRGGPQSDPDRLDGDGDGRACDSLPCPCADDAAPGPVQDQPRGRARRPNFAARVVAVIDGDTVEVRSRATRRLHTVRLIGLDTPETRKPGTPVECGGPEATRHLEKLAPSGRRVRVIGDPTQDRTDRFGRLLGYLATPGGVDLGRRQVVAGWSPAYVYERRFRRYRTYARAERAARSAERGVWGRCGSDFHGPARESPGHEGLALSVQPAPASS
jgi:endonuclease YncB( thermonuclease family)